MIWWIYGIGAVVSMLWCGRYLVEKAEKNYMPFTNIDIVTSIVVGILWPGILAYCILCGFTCAFKKARRTKRP